MASPPCDVLVTQPLATVRADAEGPRSAPIATEMFDDDELFEDAKEDLGEIESVDLQAAFDDCVIAIKLFFSNDVIGAMNLMLPWAKSSLYHSLGAAIFEFIPAMLTFDQAQIQKAQEAIKTCIGICNNHRKQYSFMASLGSIVKKPDFGAYTDVQAHAELCYAEALLLQAALTIIEGEDLAGLIKGTFKVKTCYNTYQDCWEIQEKKTWESPASKTHFLSGVQLGIATFNLMISLLPPRIVTLLEIVGFSGNKQTGLAQLEKGSLSPGMRAILCDLTLLAYHLVMCPFIGGEGDLKASEKILKRDLQEYPNSVWFMVFKARLELLQGNIDRALDIYKRTASAHDVFLQFKHLCYWEMMWIHGLKLDFCESAKFAAKLMQESSWSKTTHSYVRAAMMMQLGGDVRTSDTVLISELLRNAPLYKTRIAGKSLPMEKFIIKRCNRYQLQRGRLILPGFELLCLWNLLPTLSKNQALLQIILRSIEKTREVMEASGRDWMVGYEADNEALLLFLRGCCLAAMSLPRQAIQDFNAVLKLKKNIKEDTFLPPFAVAEMAMCYYRMGDDETTMEYLTMAKKKFSGYSLESRLHFRVHARMQMVQGIVGKVKAEKQLSVSEGNMKLASGSSSDTDKQQPKPAFADKPIPT